MKMSARFTDALVYAAAQHDDQTRKGTTVPSPRAQGRSSQTADGLYPAARARRRHVAPSSRVRNFTVRSHASSAAFRSYTSGRSSLKNACCAPG